MGFNPEKHAELLEELRPYKAMLVAVSKKKPAEDIVSAMGCGQVAFGENYVQELVEKKETVSSKAEWHFIGHLQTNKVKSIAPFIRLIQSADSFKLLKEINKEALKNNRIIDCLIQVHIANEDTKTGFSEEEAEALMLFSDLGELKNIRLRGLMGMASLTEDRQQIKREFDGLRKLFTGCRMMALDHECFDTLSMGMSSDYKIALDCGSNLVRIGSALFGERG